MWHNVTVVDCMYFVDDAVDDDYETYCCIRLFDRANDFDLIVGMLLFRLYLQWVLVAVERAPSALEVEEVPLAIVPLPELVAEYQDDDGDSC